MAARSVAEKMDVPYVFVAYCPAVLPSPRHAPPPMPPLPGEPPASATAGNLELWARDAERFNGLFRDALNTRRASMGLTPVPDVRSHIFARQPWLAADATLAPWPVTDEQDVFQTGAWILPDVQPLPPEVEEFLAGGEPPIHFGFGSIRAPQGLSEAMIQAARALGRRAIVSRGWADLSLVDNQPDCLSIGEVNQQALFSSITAVRARRPRRHWQARHKSSFPRSTTSTTGHNAFVCCASARHTRQARRPQIHSRARSSRRSNRRWRLVRNPSPAQCVATAHESRLCTW
jgi:vancomycin aglycone glucosyltransferase